MDALTEPTCGCGNPAKYNLRKVGETENVWSCNGHFRCLTYAELCAARMSEHNQNVKLTAALERAKKALANALEIINDLEGQQAMSDASGDEAIHQLKIELAEIEETLK